MSVEKCAPNVSSRTTVSVLAKYNVIEFFVNSDRRPQDDTGKRNPLLPGRGKRRGWPHPGTNAYHIIQNIQCPRRGCRSSCAPPTTTRFPISSGKKTVGLWRTRRDTFFVCTVICCRLVTVGRPTTKARTSCDVRLWVMGVVRCWGVRRVRRWSKGSLVSH